MFRISVARFGVLATHLTLFIPVCTAGENVFAWVNTVDPIPQGHFQIKNFITIEAQDSSEPPVSVRSGLEYGIAPNAEAALYVNTSSEQEHAYDSFSLQSKFMFLTPFTNPIGAALFFQGDVGQDASAVDGRLIVQKNFLDDTLVWSLDSGAAFRSFEETQNQVAANISTGLTYRFVRNWNVGFELLNRNISGLDAGHRLTLLLGPTLHYANQRWWLTFNALFTATESRTSAWQDSPGLSFRIISGITF